MVSMRGGGGGRRRSRRCGVRHGRWCRVRHGRRGRRHVGRRRRDVWRRCAATAFGSTRHAALGRRPHARRLDSAARCIHAGAPARRFSPGRSGPAFRLRPWLRTSAATLRIKLLPPLVKCAALCAALCLCALARSGGRRLRSTAELLARTRARLTFHGWTRRLLQSLLLPLWLPRRLGWLLQSLPLLLLLLLLLLLP